MIGVYRDGTGWGKACEDYILALDAAGVDVVPRPLKLNNVAHQPPERVLQLERKSAAGADTVIQHVLPHQMSYNGAVRNIGLFASETNHFQNTSWAERLDTMDDVWVINNQQVDACKQSGVLKTPTVIPHATNIERFQQSYEPLDQLKPYKDQGDFIFYFAGEYVRRKNLLALVKAFHLEFDPYENVQLVIKTNRSGMSPSDTKNHVLADIQKIKHGLKLHGGRTDFYKPEIVITDRLTEHGMMRLHSAGDCFVMPSFGEAWCIPAFDAMAMGKTPIVTWCTGFRDYITSDIGWCVGYRNEPCFGVNDTFHDLFVGNESWCGIDVDDLRSCMRMAYSQDSRQREEMAANGMRRAYDFTYEAVGELMKQSLLQQNERRA